MVRVHLGVAAAAVRGLHDLVFADPGAVYRQIDSILLLGPLIDKITDLFKVT